MADIGKYEKTAIPVSRLLTIDTTGLGLRKRHVKALIELDVTDAREIIKQKKEGGGKPLSFTAWLMKCIAEAAAEFPEVHAYRKGKKLYTFEDVDIATVVETELKGKPVPLPIVIRRVNEKSFEEISDKMVKAKNTGSPEGDLVLDNKVSASMAGLSVRFPGFIRRPAIKWFIGNPLRAKRTMGTIIVTSVGMFGITGGWAIPISIHPLTFAIGGVAGKPAAVNGTVELREMLSITILFDHDVVDGAFAARFTSRFAELVQSAYGLN